MLHVTCSVHCQRLPLEAWNETDLVDSPEIQVSRGRDGLTDLDQDGVNASELEHRRRQAQQDAMPQAGRGWFATYVTTTDKYFEAQRESASLGRGGGGGGNTEALKHNLSEIGRRSRRRVREAARLAQSTGPEGTIHQWVTFARHEA